jgi:multiple sugar transport system substrate-binding protein
MITGGDVGSRYPGAREGGMTMRPLGKWRGIVGIVATGLLATACGSPSGTPQASTPQASTPQASTPQASPLSADLTWQFWIGGTEDQAAWEKVGAQVTADHPGIKVTLQGAAWPDYWSKIGSQLASPTGPCIVGMQSLRQSAYADALVPLDDLMAANGVKPADFDQAILEGLKHDGKQIALPYDTGPMILYYNRDLFTTAGVAEPKPGWTVDDFKAAAAKLTTGGKFGFATASADLNFLAWVLTLNGAQPVENGSLALNSPAFVDGYKQYVALMQANKIAPPLTADSWTQMIEQFTSGKAAMMVEGPWSVISVKGSSKFSVGVAPMPAGAGGSKTYTAGSGFGISKTCKTPEAAFQAIVSMTSDKPLAELGAAGRAYPSRPSVQESWYGAAKIEGARETLEYAAAHSQPIVTSTNWVQVADLFYRFGVQAMSGELTPEATLQTVQDQAGTGS